jgi:hypothetical protein
MSDTRVCGYAIVYNEPVLYEDGATTYMTVEPDAFTDALRDGVQQVPLLWRSHNGPVVGHANALWSDSYGLAFSARIDAAHENKIGSITRGNDPLNRCSVNMLIAYDGEAMSTHLGQKLRWSTARHWIISLWVCPPVAPRTTAPPCGFRAWAWKTRRRTFRTSPHTGTLVLWRIRPRRSMQRWRAARAAAPLVCRPAQI